jgi:hypothetical protein
MTDRPTSEIRTKLREIRQMVDQLPTREDWARETTRAIWIVALVSLLVGGVILFLIT